MNKKDFRIQKRWLIASLTGITIIGIHFGIESYTSSRQTVDLQDEHFWSVDEDIVPGPPALEFAEANVCDTYTCDPVSPTSLGTSRNSLSPLPSPGLVASKIEKKTAVDSHFLQASPQAHPIEVQSEVDELAFVPTQEPISLDAASGNVCDTYTCEKTPSTDSLGASSSDSVKDRSGIPSSLVLPLSNPPQSNTYIAHERLEDADITFYEEEINVLETRGKVLTVSSEDSSKQNVGIPQKPISATVKEKAGIPLQHKSKPSQTVDLGGGKTVSHYDGDLIAQADPSPSDPFQSRSSPSEPVPSEPAPAFVRPTRDTPTRFDPEPEGVSVDELFEEDAQYVQENQDPRTGLGSNGDQAPGLSKPYSSSREATPAPAGSEVPSQSLRESAVQEPPIQDSPIQESQDAVQTEFAAEQDDVMREFREQEGPLINFRNVRITEYISFISRITNKNFIFNEDDLNFNVTIVSSEPTSIDNIMAALLQELRIHNLSLIEVGNNLIIHPNPLTRSPGTVVSGDQVPPSSDIITQIFKLNNNSPVTMATAVRPLLSEQAIVESLEDTGFLIVTDIKDNIEKIRDLLSSLEQPSTGLEIGQYVVQNAPISSIANLAAEILDPFAIGKTLNLVPHGPTNSIYIISSPDLVQQAIGIMRQLDSFEGSTRVLNLGDASTQLIGVEGSDTDQILTTADGTVIPEGFLFDPDGNLIQVPQGWAIQQDGTYLSSSGQRFDPAQVRIGPSQLGIGRGKPTPVDPRAAVFGPAFNSNLPLGSIENTKFYIYKLQYRTGDQIVGALTGIAANLTASGVEVSDLLTTINSIEWIEASNSLILTGTVESISKVKSLIAQIDVPLRQVLIEMLILETTLDDALNFGVDFGSRFQRPDSAGGQAFLSDNSPLNNALSGVANVAPNSPLDPGGLVSQSGFGLGVIGRNVTFAGLKFGTIGALVRMIHQDTYAEVVMNPKIVVEENMPAEIFVGINAPFQTESIVNDFGTIIGNNFEFRDVGSTLKVTPQITMNDLITLTIEQEISTIIPFPNLTSGLTTTGFSDNQQNVTTASPTTRLSRTSTTIHLPNKFFVILSGMIQKENQVNKTQIPCLGGLPGIGGAFKSTRNLLTKRNLLLFIRPTIIEDEDLIEETIREQNIYREKNRIPQDWEYHVDKGLEQLNLRDPCNVDRYQYRD